MVAILIAVIIVATLGILLLPSLTSNESYHQLQYHEDTIYALQTKLKRANQELQECREANQEHTDLAQRLKDREHDTAELIDRIRTCKRLGVVCFTVLSVVVAGLVIKIIELRELKKQSSSRWFWR